MSVLRDIYDIYKDVEDNASTDHVLKNNSRYSIAKESNKGVLQFPVLCSSVLSLEEASMINKALEREYVSFIRIITSIDSVTDEHDIETYLKRFHQNFDKVTTKDIFNENFYDLPIYNNDVVKSIIDLNENMSKLVEEMVEGDDDEETEVELLTSSDLEDEENEMNVKQIVNENFTKATSACDKIYNVNGVNGIIFHNLNENYIQELLIVKNTKNNRYSSFLTPKYKIGQKNKKMINDLSHLNENLLSIYDPGIRYDTLNDKFKPEEVRVVSESFGLKSRLGKVLNERSVSPDDFYVDTNNTNYRSVFDNNLTDNDVKKANELVPTTLHIKTYFKNEVDELQAIDYLIGVKTILHVIPSKSMIENISRGVKRDRKFFNFLKWRTGEIEFFKDFAFAIDDIKADVKSKYKDSNWWNALRRRKKHSRALKMVNLRTQLVPNTSIVISMDEVEMLKSEYSIDLMNRKIANELMNSYFLLAFIVLDSGAEVAHIFLDGQTDYMQHSYASLERENSNQAREVKNIMQILGKM